MNSPETEDSTAPDVLLFDFGGVLAHFRGIEVLANWSSDRTRDELWQHWLSSETVRAFETGELDADAFVKQLRDELRLTPKPEQILTDLRDWVPHLLPGAEELLESLSARRTALLSNTNSVHWPPYAERMDRHFERTFLSYETGWLKPDEDCFLQVARALGCEPAGLLFFDDSEINVRAAREAGLQAHVARSPAECRAELQRRGLLA